MKHSKFTRGAGAYHCNCCGKLTRETGEGESDNRLCRACFEEAGDENYHMDHHDGPYSTCVLCHGNREQAVNTTTQSEGADMAKAKIDANVKAQIKAAAAKVIVRLPKKSGAVAKAAAKAAKAIAKPVAKPKAAAAPKAPKVKVVRHCVCCGQEISGRKSVFAQGHDARTLGLFLKVNRGDEKQESLKGALAQMYRAWLVGGKQHGGLGDIARKLIAA